MKQRSPLYKSLETMTWLGIDVNYGKLSLCNLAHYSMTRNMLDRKYQVDCDTAKIRFSKIYHRYEDAIDKFIGIYSALKTDEMKLQEAQN